MPGAQPAGLFVVSATARRCSDLTRKRILRRKVARLQPSLPAAVLRANRRRRFCRGSGTALQGFNALARSLHRAPVGSTATDRRVVLDQGRSQRPALSADTHHRRLGSQCALPYSADRGNKSVNRQSLDELKQQIPLMGYLQAHDWSPARPLSGGRCMGLCPLHEDHKPSFLVLVGICGALRQVIAQKGAESSDGEVYAIAWLVVCIETPK